MTALVPMGAADITLAGTGDGSAVLSDDGMSLLRQFNAACFTYSCAQQW